jgi:hypothetical protein
MNYSKIYYQIIEKARGEERIKSCNTYFETHHIIPRCMGGLNDNNNLVKLTAREHFICHKLLVKIYPTNKSLKHAYWRMSNFKRNGYAVDSKNYAEAKILHADVCKSLPHLKNKSIKHRQNLSKSLSGKNKSDVHKQNLSMSKQSIEYKNKMSISASNAWSNARKYVQATRISGINNPRWKGYACIYDNFDVLVTQYDTVALLLINEPVSKRMVKRAIEENRPIANGPLKGFKIQLKK